MRIRHSLFSKIVVWFFLNLVILGFLLFAIFHYRFQIDPASPLWGGESRGMHNATRLARFELTQAPESEWDGILARYSKAYEVSFLLVDREGLRLGGEEIIVPQQVIEGIRGFHIPSFGATDRQMFAEHERRRFDQPRGQGQGRGHGRGRGRGDGPPPLRIKTNDPTLYWVGYHFPIFADDVGRPMPAVLLMVSDSVFKTGLYPEPMPWLITALIVVFISIAWWFPMVRSLTRPLAEVGRATDEIAKGRFSTRVNERSSDEIGRLGSAINRMASRLERYVHGQKRFMSDVAHELGSPIARLQMAVGVMDHKVNDPELRHSFEDIAEEVEIMAGLVNELLSFSRAEINPAKVQLRPVKIAEVAARVVERENTAGADIAVGIDESLTALADPELLVRALANLVRNAVRYAGDAGPIRLDAHPAGDRVLLEVVDSGPGVPPEHIDQLFEPFFRKESDRDRQSGGAGLGLAIVKTCIEACQGTVSARNLSPSGLAVTITLNAQ